MLDQRNDFDFYSIKINKMLMFLILLSYSRANTMSSCILDLVRVLLQTGPALNQMLPIWPLDGVIYSWLFKYTQQHTAGFTENSWNPRLLRLALLAEKKQSNDVQLKISCFITFNPFSWFALYTISSGHLFV